MIYYNNKGNEIYLMKVNHVQNMLSRNTAKETGKDESIIIPDVNQIRNTGILDRNLTIAKTAPLGGPSLLVYHFCL